MNISELTERELAVAALCGRRLIVKRIAAELSPPISERRVLAIIAAVAIKIGVPDGQDDRLCVGDWWRETFPITTRANEAA